MKLTNKEIELFDRALLGELREAEQQQFEENLEANPDFRNRYDWFRRVVQSVKEKGREERLTRIASWEEHHRPKSRVRRLYYAVAAAAAAVLIMVVGLLQFGSDSMMPVERYFEPYPDVITTRGDKAMAAEAMKEYDNANYEAAIDKMNQFLATENNDMIRFYLAESYLASGRFAEADSLYGSLPPKTALRDVAEFHHAIAVWSSGDEQRAREMLRTIANNPEHSYSNKAQDWLDS